MKKNMILLMAVLLGLCWYTTVGSLLSSENKYQEYMKNAESFEERELYLDANPLCSTGRIHQSCC